MTLATTGACGRQHKGVVSLVLAGPTPGLVVRRHEKLATPLKSFNMRNWPSRADNHEALGHTSEAASAARLIRIADVRSETAEREDGAVQKSTSSAREKPTKVNVDDEGRSGVRSGNGLTPGVGKGSRPEEERMCHTFCVKKRTAYREREDVSACGKVLEESKQSNWRDWTAPVGGRDGSSHERIQLPTSDEV